jgi:hypothetical protein
MYRKLMLAAVLAATAAPAFADTAIEVNIAGLDPQAVHTAILRAAQSACFTELREDGPMVQLWYRPICIRAAVADGEQKYDAMNETAPP